MQVSQIGATVPESEAKVILLEEIDNFIQEKVTYADEQVARTAETKVDSGDVVLTFAFSSAVLSTFLLAKEVELTSRYSCNAELHQHCNGKKAHDELYNIGM